MIFFWPQMPSNAEKLVYVQNLVCVTNRRKISDNYIKLLKINKIIIIKGLICPGKIS